MYYFAYGSNMSLEHMRRLCGWHCRLLGRALLDGYEIGVDAKGYANIRAKSGDFVNGVMYEIDREGLDLLDEFEGYPDTFGRQEVVVKDEFGVEYKAQVYAKNSEDFGGQQIKGEYWRRVVKAAAENRLPEEWVKKLESFLSLKQI